MNIPVSDLVAGQCQVMCLIEPRIFRFAVSLSGEAALSKSGTMNSYPGDVYFWKSPDT
ncbi:hypothetical protein [Desulfonema magnum]|uniref:Uncharacterized protein n=1 Tax=Desulfonema magnum TaxID=45655 RepID=A0A975GWB6_9BACT|nr:hypothetical protein [Desulfonema magnum]QTA93838.1 Uncharacterized protein dnm_099460 [Desulfonema magnum]